MEEKAQTERILAQQPDEGDALKKAIGEKARTERILAQQPDEGDALKKAIGGEGTNRENPGTTA